MRPPFPGVDPLVDDAGRYEQLLGVTSGIWAPSCVTTGRSALVKPGMARVPFLRYDVPSTWQPAITSASPHADITALEERGWRYLKSPGTLLTSFVRLAEEDGPRQQTRRVRAFVEHYGPLWRCQEHQGYFWSSSCQPSDTHPPCRWIPIEKVSAFIEEARHVRAVLECARLLTEDMPVHEELAGLLRYLDPEDSLAGQRAGLILEIRVRLRELEAWHVAPIWRDTPTPQVQMGSGVGFLPLVWVELTQAICKAHRLVQCSRCKKWYVRTTRLQAGRGNYCPACGPNAARNESARRRRQGIARAVIQEPG